MLVNRAHKIRIDANVEDVAFFKCCIGTARFAYNWGLQEWNDTYAIGGRPSEAGLRRFLNSIKKEAYPWMGIHASGDRVTGWCHMRTS